MSIHQQIKANIKEYGLSVIGTEGFAYSIGRASAGQSDIIICTDYTRTNHMMINMVHQYLRDGGKLGIVNSLIEGKNGEPMPVEIRLIETTNELVNEFVCQADHFYRCNPEYAQGSMGNVSYVQVLLPDANGLLPTQAGYDHDNMPQRVLEAITIN